ncbi:MAG TPA: SpoIID/LytB domain-containing protein [Bryobacteraceae bacterium]|nr:SpoIID/LytB domain-containing protein [Bryobacteraceae bacterium]
MIATVAISVFSLFHPVELDVQPSRGSVLTVVDSNGTRTLEGQQIASLRSVAKITGHGGSVADFFLSVPGKIRREFRGTLELREQDGHLTAIVQMDLEMAVASIVAAEGAGAPLEMLKAQAVVARSFLIAARGRHRGFDFCDTTHCQYLRGSPGGGSAAKGAQEATRGLVLEYENRVILALYSANCGGHTRTPADAGWRMAGYPFFAVDCPARGAVSGHRIGMCQSGAVLMARHGGSFREILAHFFPAATVATEP